jgi:hypothetical protein
MSRRSILAPLSIVALLLACALDARAQSSGTPVRSWSLFVGYANIGVDERTMFNGAIVPGRGTTSTISTMQLGMSWYVPVWSRGDLSIGASAGFDYIFAGGAADRYGEFAGPPMGFDFPILVGARMGRGATTAHTGSIGAGLGIGALPAIYFLEGMRDFQVAPAFMAEVQLESIVSGIRFLYALDYEHQPTLTTRKFSFDVVLGL